MSDEVWSALIALFGTMFTTAMVPVVRYVYLTIRDRRRARRLLDETKQQTLQAIDQMTATIEAKNRELEETDAELDDVRASARYWHEEAMRWQQTAQHWRTEAETYRRRRHRPTNGEGSS